MKPSQSKPWLEGLNPAQRDAVTHGEGPLLIIAGAGTGKTRTLACRVADLIDRGVPAERILLLTFTRRASAEMIRRASHMSGRDAEGGVWGGTFHAVANRLLRAYGRAIGLNNEFTVMDQSDAADLMNLIRNELGHAKTNRRFPRKETLVKIYSRAINAGEKLAIVLKKQFPWVEDAHDGMAEIFEHYAKRKRAQNVLDYDDLLLFWSALANAPGVGEMVAERFEHILVDEYQDTNTVQARILKGMRRNNKNITVVGDDAQSIYSFRAATIRNILDFEKTFEGARVVTLEQNYRSIQPILDASNAVMDVATERYTKNLWSDRPSERRPQLVTCIDESHQCREVSRRILAHREEGIPLMHQAVLFRAGHHSSQLEIELARRNIPFHKYGGLKFVEAAHIKDLLAFLRVLENPWDELSWFRILQLLDGVGPRSARRLMDGMRIAQRNNAAPTPDATADDAAHALDADAVTDIDPAEAEAALAAESRPATPASGELASPLKVLFESPPAPPPGARDQFLTLVVALAECCGWKVDVTGKSTVVLQRGGVVPALPDQLARIRDFYEPIFQRIYENAAIRLRDIDELAQIASQYTARDRFITDLTLDPPVSTSDLAGAPYLDEDYLILSTIHSAKGCEWDAVHVIHAADGMIPSDMSTGDAEGVEEERRLFYVALTRAKDHLHVYFPLRYYHTKHVMGDGHSYAQLTRFISPEMRHFFDDLAGDGEHTGLDAAHWDEASQIDPVVDDVDRYINDLWQP